MFHAPFPSFVAVPRFSPILAVFGLDPAPIFGGGMRPYGPPSSTMKGVIDIVGDGSLFALWVPGHTAGSVAYLARTVGGPILFTGDTCHTLWGWEHSVEPGTFTANLRDNQVSLLALKELAARVLSKKTSRLDVFVGHELTGKDTGVAATQR